MENGCILFVLTEDEVNENKTNGKGDSMKKKFVVDVYRTLAQTIEVEAESEDEAREKAFHMAENGEMAWSTDMLNDELDANVCGEVDENGERQYY